MKPIFKFRARAASDVGGRKNNEDAWFINDEIGLFIVADGMGGHDKGEVASWFASDNLEKIVRSEALANFDITVEPGDIAEGKTNEPDELMEYAVLTINKKLYDLNQKNTVQDLPCTNDPAMAETLKKRRLMGTTLISLLVHKDKAYITHVGDSRAYRIANGAIQRLTHDHSWVEEHVRDGTISPAEAATHEKRNVITRSVGFKPMVNADIDVLTLYSPERFLLCSDGLSNVVTEDTLLRLGQMQNLSSACRHLVEEAKERGGKDNITVVIVDVSGKTDKQEKGREETVYF